MLVIWDAITLIMMSLYWKLWKEYTTAGFNKLAFNLTSVGITIPCAFSDISWSLFNHFSPMLDKTPHSSAMKARYGVFFKIWKFERSFTLDVVVYTISCDIVLWYIMRVYSANTWLCVHWQWNTWARCHLKYDSWSLECIQWIPLVCFIVNEHTTKCSCFYHICVFKMHKVYSFMSLNMCLYSF